MAKAGYDCRRFANPDRKERTVYLHGRRTPDAATLYDRRENSAEVFLSNMDYAQVSAAVVTQEFIDGLQNEYLQEVKLRYPDRFLYADCVSFAGQAFYSRQSN